MDFPLLLWTDSFTVATVNANKRTDNQQLLDWTQRRVAVLLK